MDIEEETARVAGSAMEALLIRALVELDVAPHVAAPATASEVADGISADPRAIARILRAAEALGLVTCEANGRFRLTRSGEFLRSDREGSIATRALLWTSPWVLGAWERLASSARHGGSAFTERHGVAFWDFLATDAAAADLFDTAMSEGATARAAALAAGLDIPPGTSVVDIGGGEGQFARALVERVAGVVVCVADRPDVIARASRKNPDVSSTSVRFEPTDIFASVPTDGDVYVLSRVLHNWDDTKASAILTTCRAAMSKESTLYVLEHMRPHDATLLSRAEHLEIALTDLNMWVLYGGGERTEAEYTQLLEEAGYSVRRVTSTRACSIIEARPTQ